MAGRPKKIDFERAPGISRAKNNKWRWDLYSPKRRGGHEDTAEAAYYAREAAKRSIEAGAADEPAEEVQQSLTKWIDDTLVFRIPEGAISGLRRANVESNVSRHIKPRLGALKLGQITGDVVRQFVTDLGEVRQKGGEPLSPHTIANVRNDLALLLAPGVPKIWPTNPCAAVTVNRKKRKRNAQGERVEYKRTLTPRERLRLLAKARDYGEPAGWMYGFILTGLRTGLRKSELIGLRWIHVDFKNRVLRIEDQVHRIKGQVVTTDTKTEAGDRIIPISDSVLTWLEANRGNGSRYVFCDPDTKNPLAHRKVAAAFTAIAKAARLWDREDALGRKLANPSPHDMRHTFGAMHANELKTPLVVLKELMGHEDVATTAEYYVDATLADLAAAMKGVP